MSTLLDLPTLLRLQNLQLLSRVIAEGALAGLHRSAHHGSSVEFAEHKEYAPGDDLRHIDWRAYGRIDKYYVKRFEEETELRGYILLDVSGSMSYGRAGQLSKLHFAKLLSAAISYLRLRQNDPTGLLLFGEDLRQYIPPHGGGAHLSDLCGALERVAGEGRTALPDGITYLSEVARRRSLCIVLSDLLPSSEPLGDTPAGELVERYAAQLRARLAGLRAQKHDVVVVQVLDADELELPFSGLTWFEDIEPGPDGPARLFVDPGDVRAAYKAEIDRFLSAMRRGLREADVEYHLVQTSRSIESVLLDILRGPLRRHIRK